MKKRFVIGVSIVTILGVAMGSQLFNRTSAQDPGKKAEPAEKKVEADLFEVLKKSLEGKKETPVVPAPAPISADPVLPPVKDDKAASAPPVAHSAPPPLALPALADPKQAPAKELVPPLSAAPKPAIPMIPAVAPATFNVPPPQPKIVPPFAPIAKDPVPALPPIDPPASPPTVRITPAKTPIPDQLAALKDCPWSLQVDLVDGQTVITATVNKKHEFKIACQSLDLQTGKSVLKAAGKVQITGDMLTGHCEQLSISLHEDRLLLEGAAEVSIQKVATKVSSEASTSFELKGQTLDLRISDYTSAKLIQTSRAVDAIPMRNNLSPALPNIHSKNWTSYGTLRPAKIDLGGKEIAWSLQDREGKVITYLVARDGGTLRQYEGQTISVIGATEQIHGRPMLRVTHIALP